MSSAQASHLASRICCSLFVLTASVCPAEETPATPGTVPQSPVSTYIPIRDPFFSSRPGQHAEPRTGSESMPRGGPGQPEGVTPKGIRLKGLPVDTKQLQDRHERHGDFWVPEGFDRFASLNAHGKELSHGRHDSLEALCD